MAFESVNVNALKYEIIDCIYAINYKSSQDLINSISSDLVWNAGAKNKLMSSISILINNKYKVLENKLKVCLDVSAKITHYKLLAEENIALKKQIAGLTPNMYYAESYEESYTDQSGNVVTETKYRECVNPSIKQMIVDMQNKIASNEQKMIEIETEVDLLI